MTTIHTLVLVIHVIIGAMIIGLVLVQRGKGAETGAAFRLGGFCHCFRCQGFREFSIPIDSSAGHPVFCDQSGLGLSRF